MGLEVLLGQAAVFGTGQGSDHRADGAEAVADPAVGGQEGPLGAVAVPGTPSSPREVSDSRQNSSRVTSVRNSGRSSSARHPSAVSTARTGSGRGRPVRWASAASMTGAVPERSVSPAAKATV